MPRPRVVAIAPPEELGRHDGLAYALFLPEGEPSGSVLIFHGAGSAKESHYDFARACRAHGLAALSFDIRGHGESEGAMGRGLFDDLAAMASLLPDAPLALRGSICPASAAMLRRGLRNEAFEVRADVDALDALLAEHDEMLAAEMLDVPLLLLHAEGDERVPVQHSRDLAEVAPQARLIAVPGGHHRSVQHDGELQATALRWLEKSLSRR
jgi:uncharacterized protein